MLSVYTNNLNATRPNRSQNFSFYRRPDGEKVLTLRIKIRRVPKVEEFTRNEIVEAFRTGNISSRFLRFEPRPDGQNLLCIHKKKHGETVFEKWTENQILEMFQSA